MLVDTHCHLDDPSLSDRLAHVLANARCSGVSKMIVPGVNPANWERIASLAGATAEVYSAFGLHPMLAPLWNEATLISLESRLKGAVAVGEIGLDYTYAQVPKEHQIVAFRSQLRVAVKFGLPVIIHCRKAFADLLNILKEEQVFEVGGVMHAYSGSPEIARECIRLGLYISVAGTVTYKNAVKPLEVVKRIPLDVMLLESDAPDLTPEPYRGHDNEPGYLVETGKRIAELKGISLKEVAEVTTGNARRLFRI